MFVRAKVTHIQPGTLAYREEGSEFDHEGKPYKHVEAVKRAKSEPVADHEGKPYKHVEAVKRAKSEPVAESKAEE